ncbi:MAG: hypothetical protein HY774_22415 [Acidobacteria bacterium]|nr:hypothetical protein [Acidobacteriota bacterium]
MQMTEISPDLVPPIAIIFPGVELDFGESHVKTVPIDSEIEFGESIFLFPQTIDLKVQGVTQLLQNGWFVIPETPIQLRIQKISSRAVNQEVQFLIELEDEWPNIEWRGSITPNIQMASSNQVRFSMKGGSTQAGIHFTRLAWLLMKANRFHLNTEHQQTLIECQTPASSEEWRSSIQILGRFYRKVQFVEKTLDVTISIPYSVTSEMLDELDRVFRGLLRNVVIDEVDTVSATSKTPVFIDVEAISGSKEGAISIVTDGIWLFGQKLSTMQVLIFIPLGEIINREEVRVAQQQPGPVTVKIKCHNARVNFIVKNEVDRESEFQEFHQELTAKEPEEIVQWVTEPIWGMVSRFEAMELALNSVHRRYAGKTSVLMQAVQKVPEKSVWKVRIELPDVDFRGKAGWIFIFIDQKTGEIVSENTDNPDNWLSQEEQRFASAFRWACNRTWLKRNRARYLGEWVSLSEGILVSHGRDLREVLQIARAKGQRLPQIFYIEPVAEKSEVKVV